MNFFYSNQKAGEDLRLTSHSPELAAVLLRDRPGVSLAAWAVKVGGLKIIQVWLEWCCTSLKILK